MRRAFCKLLLVATMLLPGLASAQTFPTRPIRVIVPFPAGGASDAQTRAFADALAAFFGQRVLVDNRPGAGGNLGTDAAAKAPADGYTLVTGGPNIINTRYLFRDTPFQWERDLEPLGLMFSSSNVLWCIPPCPRARCRNSSPIFAPIRDASTSHQPARVDRSISPPRCSCG